jgi:hypothetical protein
MMCVRGLLAPAFMGEFFHLCLCLSLFKLVIEVIMERVVIQIDDKNNYFPCTLPFCDLLG